MYTSLNTICLKEAIDAAAKQISDALEEPYAQNDHIYDVGTPTIHQLLPQDPHQAAELAHEKITSFKYSEVPHCWIRLWEDAQLRIAIEAIASNNHDLMKCFTELIKRLDMAWIKAQGFQRGSLIQRIFRVLDGFEAAGLDSEEDAWLGYEGEEGGVLLSHTKKRVFSTDTICQLMQHDVPHEFPFGTPKFPCVANKVFSFDADRNRIPTLGQFERQFEILQAPIFLGSGIAHWPARRLWKDPVYWLQRTHGGHRLIPVEIGARYTDDGWDQRLMSFGDFLAEYMINSGQNTETAASWSSPGLLQIGYFAQHEFLRQMPGFYEDVMTPDYCHAKLKGSYKIRVNDPEEQITSSEASCNHPSRKRKRKCSEGSNGLKTDIETRALSPESDDESLDDANSNEIKIQIWLGPANTISPAHIDSSQNIFCQVMGYKYIRLYPPNEGKKLYPGKLWNTAQVDVGLEVDWEDEGFTNRKTRMRLRAEQREKYPLLQHAEYQECTIGPGQCLFIPKGWWHYVQSLTPSASVSFWWDSDPIP